jgi:DNA-binding CsgD family transcriptional regulator
MPGSRLSDARALANVARGLWEIDDLAGFRARLPEQLHELVDCEIASYNEIGPGPGDVFVVADPMTSLENSAMFESFSTFAWQNPLAAHYARTGERRALRMSDFISTGELHRLELYDLVYRHIATEFQLAFTVPTAAPLIGITVSRAASDFSDRELALLEAARGLILSAHRSLRDRASLEVLMRAVEQTPDGPFAVMLVEAGGAFAPAHERAERLLIELETDQASTRTLREWARARRRQPRAGPSAPLTIATRAGKLRADYVRGSLGNLDALVVRLSGADQPQALMCLGLTRRQADVLLLLWRGLSNAQIAGALDISEHTVRHHLEDVYRRLEVSSRPAAAHLAGRALAEAGLPLD